MNAHAEFHGSRASICQAAIVAAVLVLVSCQVQQQPETATPEGSAATASPHVTAIPLVLSPAAFQTTPSQPAIVTVTTQPEPTETAIVPSPTFAASLFRTTPDTRWEACSDSLPSRLRAGDFAYVSYDPFISHRVRTRPSLSISSSLGLIAPGEVIEILEGPECFSDAVWWKVSSVRKDLQGWAQEGDEDAYWLIPASAAAGSRVSIAEQRQACPVSDSSFCEFVRALEPAIVSGDLEAILDRTFVAVCPADSGGSAGQDLATAIPAAPQECAYLGVGGTGLTGFEWTSTSLIATTWSFYSGSFREIEVLLLPPFPEINEPDTIVPESPAVYIATQDPNWDWWLSIEKIDGDWMIISFLMLARELRAADVLDVHAVPWR